MSTDPRREPSRPFAVIGGGIGGLAAAIFLAGRGFGAEVYERSVASRTAGLGINLQPYAMAALDSVGLAGEVWAAGRPCRRWAFFDRGGREIVSEPIPTVDGWPRISISRGALTALLTDAAVARGCAYRNLELVGLDAGGGGAVSLEMVDPVGHETEWEAGAVIGADGISSTVRRLLVPSTGLPRHAGKVLWRGTTRRPPVLDGDTMVLVGTCARKLVLYPIGPTHPDGRQDVNWVAEMVVPEDAGREAWDDAVSAETVADAYADFDFDWLDVPQLVLGAAQVLRFSMLDRDPLDHWCAGRVALVGDAAHPMYPVGSHGASQAVRDAASIAEALSRSDDVGAAFARYEAERRPEANALIVANRGMGPDAVLDLAADGTGPPGSSPSRPRRDEALALLQGYRALTASRTA